jgi:hypothetical protein
MALIQINKNPSKRDVRLFSGLWFTLFFAFVGFQTWRKTGHLEWALYIWSIAATISVVCLIVPAVGRAVFVGLSYLTFPIGYVVSHVVMAIVFYGVFAPIGLVMRIVGYDPMQRGFDKTARSYWVERIEKRSTESYFRQF